MVKRKGWTGIGGGFVPLRLLHVPQAPITFCNVCPTTLFKGSDVVLSQLSLLPLTTVIAVMALRILDFEPLGMCQIVKRRTFTCAPALISHASFFRMVLAPDFQTCLYFFLFFLIALSVIGSNLLFVCLSINTLILKKFISVVFVIPIMILAAGFTLFWREVLSMCSLLSTYFFFVSLIRSSFLLAYQLRVFFAIPFLFFCQFFRMLLLVALPRSFKSFCMFQGILFLLFSMGTSIFANLVRILQAIRIRFCTHTGFASNRFTIWRGLVSAKLIQKFRYMAFRTRLFCEVSMAASCLAMGWRVGLHSEQAP